jgi:hypothetical protein
VRPPRFLGVLHEHSALVRRLVRAREREIHDVEELFGQANSAKVHEGFSRFFSELRALLVGRGGVQRLRSFQRCGLEHRGACRARLGPVA